MNNSISLRDIMISINNIGKSQKYNKQNAIDPAITYRAYKNTDIAGNTSQYFKQNHVEIQHEGVKIDVNVRSRQLNRVLLSADDKNEYSITEIKK
jgi:ABC-type metal ion transport system substrate-binding protein